MHISSNRSQLPNAPPLWRDRRQTAAPSLEPSASKISRNGSCFLAALDISMVAYRLVRAGMRIANHARHFYWRWRGMPVHGVMALAYDRQGRLLLVRQSYSNYWVLPGGGRKAAEPAVAAALREMREEVGLAHHDKAALIGTLEKKVGSVPNLIAIVRITGAEYVFRRSLEVVACQAFAPRQLPRDLSGWARQILALHG